MGLNNSQNNPPRISTASAKLTPTKTLAMVRWAIVAPVSAFGVFFGSMDAVYQMCTKTTTMTILVCG